MKYLVAVSGGVDSVVLLDMLSNGDDKLTVAHVDHGIRGDESAADARFVEALAAKYDLPFVSTKLNLGANASEEQAREVRYNFLFEVALKKDATIVTAHHLDDLVETIAINLKRGTGWRGLAVLSRSGIQRPLLDKTKRELIDYALEHKLEWVEDHTNASDDYQRNRIRKRINVDFAYSDELKRLRDQQIALRDEIDAVASEVLAANQASRYFYLTIETALAVELLGAHIFSQVGVRPVRSQLERALLAIKTARAGSIYQVGEGVELDFTTRTFSVKQV